MKAVKAELQKTKPDRVEAFEKGAAAYAKKIVANFKDYEFYTGESMNPDGMIALLNYRVGQNHVSILTGETDHSISPLGRRTAPHVCTILPILDRCDTNLRPQLTLRSGKMA